MLFSAKSAHQVAALPYREDPDTGAIAFLMITSRRRGRWVLPKGWAEEGESLDAAARREASEEAGVEGTIAPRMVGRYRYTKQMRDGYDLPCTVSLFPLRVTQQREHWDEQDARQRAWMTPADAAKVADDPGLAHLLGRIAARPDAELGRFLDDPKPLAGSGHVLARLIAAVRELCTNGQSPQQSTPPR